MKHQANLRHTRLGVLLLAAVLLVGLMPLAQAASAATANGWHEGIELDGKFEDGTFSFTSNTSQLFQISNAVPGDSWSGTISIWNKTGQDIEVALLTIVSNLDDLTLYNTLSLDIFIQGETVYTGKYSQTSDPITTFYTVPSGSSLRIDATVGIPASVGNEIMGKKMDSTWTFEARYLDGDTPVPDDPEPEPFLYPYTVKYLDRETGTALIPSKVGCAAFATRVIEYAPNIAGYTPDAKSKSATINSLDTIIIFYYDKIKDPDPEPTPSPSDDPEPTPSPSDDPEPTPSPSDDPEPTPSPSDDPEPTPSPSDDPEPSETTGVQTGDDLTESNTTPAVYIVLFFLCVLAAFTTFLHVRAAKRRSGT